MLVKICGLTRREDVEAAVDAGADMVGFVFVPGTPRAVTVETVRWVRELTGVASVGVFRDAALDEIVALRRALALHWIQLHGDEPDAFVGALGPRVIRRVDLRDGDPWRAVERLAGRCLPLIDPGSGSGVAVDWHAMPAPPKGVRFGLAGGLGPENVADAVRRMRPGMVDVSSGVEVSPGVKDHALIQRFVSNARAAAAEPPPGDPLESAAGTGR